MALITATEFRASRYGDIASNVVKIQDVIRQAEARLARYTDRKLEHATYTEIHRPNRNYLFTREYPVTAVTSMRRRRGIEAVWEDLDVAYATVVDPDAPMVEWSGVSLGGYDVEITYDAGYEVGSIPEDIRAAVILQTVALVSIDPEVYGVGDSKEPGIKHIQRDVDAMMDPHKRLRRFV